MVDPVVAGVDGSEPSVAAARYAAGLAERRGAPLRLVHGYLHPLGYGSLGLTAASPALPDIGDEARAMLDRLATAVRDEHPGLDVTVQHVALGGAPALIEASAHADVVVVGHRGQGGFAELLLGSVGSQVSAHARAPVIVVRPEPAGPDAPVVVGVDGSDGSEPAVEFAFHEASGRGVPLVAVHVYWADPADTVRDPDADADARARAEADAVLDAALAPAEARYPDVEVRRTPVHSLNPEYSLVEASRTASLLAIGSRGRGGFAGLLLGSVSQALVHHAYCPVAVVHPHGHRR
jgi:nucleotide-binding universal stress UspA family protein